MVDQHDHMLDTLSGSRDFRSWFSGETIVLFDTEYMTWEGAQARGWSCQNEFREIVQIGAIQIETEAFSELSSLTVFVKPVKNPTLSQFFVDLTGISQEVVDKNSVTLTEALARFSDWSDDLPLYALGKDGWVVEEHCRLLGIPCPIASGRFHNIRELFQAHGIDASQYMSSTIVEAFGESPTRRCHDGLSDTRTIADGIRLLKQKIKKNKLDIKG